MKTNQTPLKIAGWPFRMTSFRGKLLVSGVVISGEIHLHHLEFLPWEKIQKHGWFQGFQLQKRFHVTCQELFLAVVSELGIFAEGWWQCPSLGWFYSIWLDANNLREEEQSDKGEKAGLAWMTGNNGGCLGWLFFYQKQMLVGGWPKKWCSLFHEVSRLHVRFGPCAEPKAATGCGQSYADAAGASSCCAILNEDKRLLSTKLHLALIRCKTNWDRFSTLLVHSGRFSWQNEKVLPHTHRFLLRKYPGGGCFSTQTVLWIVRVVFCKNFPQEMFSRLTIAGLKITLVFKRKYIFKWLELSISFPRCKF